MQNKYKFHNYQDIFGIIALYFIRTVSCYCFFCLVKKYKIVYGPTKYLHSYWWLENIEKSNLLSKLSKQLPFRELYAASNNEYKYFMQRINESL